MDEPNIKSIYAGVIIIIICVVVEFPAKESQVVCSFEEKNTRVSLRILVAT